MSLLILLFILEWNYLSLRWNTSAAYREMLGGALYASDSLFTTSGDPVGWERIGVIDETNVNSIGLVNSRNQLDNQKLEKLLELNSSDDNNYSIVLQKLGIPGYNMYINITDLEGELTYYSYGRKSGLNNSVVLERFVILNDSIVSKAKVEVWR
jgi:hypothetical protein